MSINLTALAHVIGYEMPEPLMLTGVSIDSREIKRGDLFVALPGTRVDGYDFIPSAVEKGAGAVLTHKAHPEVDVPQLVHSNLEEALALMARAHRDSMSCKVAALTGSNGKTSVKEMLGCVLSQVGPTWITPGNKNNHLGVPLSVLQLTSTHQFGVFELGANHQGEIAHTVAIVKPDTALINNIGPAHLEGFGSIEGVARGKGEIYAGLEPGKYAIVNADDAYAHFWDDILADKKVLRFSAQDVADIYAKGIGFDEAGNAYFQLVTKSSETADVHLNVPGKHHIHNALAAAGLALSLGLPLNVIAKGLTAFNGVSGRLTPKKTATGALILDDSYNANLSSILAGIDVLSRYNGTRILVLGDIAELGDQVVEHHEAVGSAALDSGIDRLLTCGTLSEAASDAFGDKAQHFDNHAALVQALSPLLDQKTTVLVKGSRSSAMEKVVQGLLG